MIMHIIFDLSSVMMLLVLLRAHRRNRFRLPYPGFVLIALAGVLCMAGMRALNLDQPLRVALRTLILFIIACGAGCTTLSICWLAAGWIGFLQIVICSVVQVYLAFILNHRWLDYLGFVFFSLNQTEQAVSYVLSTLLVIFITAVLYRPFKELSRLSGPFCICIGTLSIASSIVLVILINSFEKRYSPNVTMQAILLSVSFIILFVLSTTTLLIFNQMLYTEKKELALLLSMNDGIEKGYTYIQSQNEALRCQVHDFRKHLANLRGLEKPEADTYIEDLLKHPLSPFHEIHSGDPYVDAVLNSRASQMRDLSINFQYIVRFPERLPIAPSDLCAIISNQLDNAIEACEKIPSTDARWIHFLIDQRGGMIIISCRNSIVPHSVSLESMDHTSKTQGQNLHGYGIRNIRLCAERNGGILQFKIEEDSLESRVLLQPRNA